MSERDHRAEPEFTERGKLAAEEVIFSNGPASPQPFVAAGCSSDEDGGAISDNDCEDDAGGDDMHLLTVDSEEEIRSYGEAMDYGATTSNGAEKVVSDEKLLKKVHKIWAQVPGSRPASLSVLHNELLDMCGVLSLTAEEQEARRAAIQSIESIVQELWPEATVKLFGSTATGLCLPSSDLDLVILSGAEPGTGPAAGRGYGAQKWMKRLTSKLKRHKFATSIEPVPLAKVPILRFVTTASNLACDVSFDASNGPQALPFVRRQLALYPALRPLCVALKCLLGQHGLTQVYTGGVGSYCLLLMLLHLLQVLGPREVDLGRLLLAFCAYYGSSSHGKGKRKRGACTGHDYKTDVVTVTGVRGTKEERGWNYASNPELLSVEDPQAPNNDIGKGSYRMLEVREVLRNVRAGLEGRLWTPGTLGAVLDLKRTRADIGTSSKPPPSANAARTKHERHHLRLSRDHSLRQAALKQLKRAHAAGPSGVQPQFRRERDKKGALIPLTKKQRKAISDWKAAVNKEKMAQVEAQKLAGMEPEEREEYEKRKQEAQRRAEKRKQAKEEKAEEKRENKKRKREEESAAKRAKEREERGEADGLEQDCPGQRKEEPAQPARSTKKKRKGEQRKAASQERRAAVALAHTQRAAEEVQAASRALGLSEGEQALLLESKAARTKALKLAAGMMARGSVGAIMVDPNVPLMLQQKVAEERRSGGGTFRAGFYFADVDGHRDNLPGSSHHGHKAGSSAGIGAFPWEGAQPLSSLAGPGAGAGAGAGVGGPHSSAAKKQEWQSFWRLIGRSSSGGSGYPPAGPAALHDHHHTHGHQHQHRRQQQQQQQQHQQQQHQQWRHNTPSWLQYSNQAGQAPPPPPPFSPSLPPSWQGQYHPHEQLGSNGYHQPEHEAQQRLKRARWEEVPHHIRFGSPVTGAAAAGGAHAHHDARFPKAEGTPRHRRWLAPSAAGSPAPICESAMWQAQQ